MYSDDNNYNNYNGFFYGIKRTVYKWWCVVYKPVYKLTHHGYWPQEKEPYAKYPTFDDMQQSMNPQEATPISEAPAAESVPEPSTPVDSVVTPTPEPPITSVTESEDASASESEIPSNVDADTLSKANEIMERLAREAAEDEAKKAAQIDAVRRKAAEEEHLARILKSTEVDITPFIEEGKASQSKDETEV